MQEDNKTCYSHLTIGQILETILADRSHLSWCRVYPKLFRAYMLPNVLNYYERIRLLKDTSEGGPKRSCYDAHNEELISMIPIAMIIIVLIEEIVTKKSHLFFNVRRFMFLPLMKTFYLPNPS